MTRLILIRHATNDTVGKRIAGRKEGIHLNEEGKEQAEELASWLKALPVTAVYSSPLERAQQTAQPLANVLQLEVQVEAALIEIDFGNWTYKEIEALKGDESFQLFNSFRSNASIPGGESMLLVQARIVGCLQQLCLRHPQQTVAVVSHGDVIKAALAHYAGIHLDLMSRLEISPASVSIVDVFQETARIVLVNGMGRLDPLRLP